MENKHKKYLLYILSYLTLITFSNCKEKTVPSIEITIKKIKLDVSYNPEGMLPPIIDLEMHIKNNTNNDFVFSYNDDDSFNSKMIILNLKNKQTLFLTGYGAEIIKKKESIITNNTIYIREENKNFFNFQKNKLINGKVTFKDEDAIFLLKNIKEEFSNSILIYYLNSQYANHLEVINQNNYFFEKDKLILINWSDDVKYEVYTEGNRKLNTY